MTFASTHPSAAASAARPTRRVVDAPTRLAHALMALSFLAAYLTGDSEHWRALHVTSGYVLGIALAFRVVYGLVGPRQARVTLWFRKLAAAPDWLRTSFAALRHAQPANEPWRQGRNLLVAAVIAALPLLMVPLLLSGLGLHLEWVTGGWADGLSEVHEALAEGLLVLVLVHLGLILGLSFLRRQNQARLMLDGRVVGQGPDLATRNHGLLSALLLVAVLGFVGWQLQHPPTTPAPGATPSAGTGVDGRHQDRDDD